MKQLAIIMAMLISALMANAQLRFNKTSVTLMIKGGKHTENIWEQITDAAIRHYPHINVNGSRVLIINNGK